MPLPLIAWAVIEIGVAVAARVIVRQVAKTVIKEAVKTGVKQVAKEGVKQVAKEGTKQVAKKVTQAAAKVVKKKGSPTKGNTAPRNHKGKQKKKNKKDDCKKTFLKYPVHEYRHREQNCTKGVHQSHHVVQNAQFMVGGKPISTICPGYSRDSAPCIPLKGKSTDPNAPHGIVTKMQNDEAAKAKATGKAPTYQAASNNAKKQLKAAGLKDQDIKCIMKKVDEMLLKMCPGLTGKTVLRIPGS